MRHSYRNIRAAAAALLSFAVCTCGTDPASFPAAIEGHVQADAGGDLAADAIADDAPSWLDGDAGTGPRTEVSEDFAAVDEPSRSVGEPIEAPPFEWTWIDFPKTRCADDSITGLGVNINPDADLLFVYLEGGGACWDYTTCSGVIATSLHLDGFDEDDFFGLIASVFINAQIFDRDLSKNPLANASYVFIPYCTGDIFGGNRLARFEGLFPWETDLVHFNGHNNIRSYLERLVPTFADVDRVIVSGSSAGGFGAGLNWAAFQEAFGDTPVDLIDDSGPPIAPVEGLWEQMRDTWNLQLPADCSDCAESPDRLIDYFRRTLLRDRRMGLLSYDRDSVISAFYRILPREFEERLTSLLDQLDAEPNAQYFVVSGPLHTLLITGFTLTEASDGTPVYEWVRQMVEGDPDWSSHRP